MAIQNDSLGFLLGERRLKEMAEGIVQTEDNTKQILQVLTGHFEEIKQVLQENSSVKGGIDRFNREGRAIDASDSGLEDIVRRTIEASETTLKTTEKALDAAIQQVNRKIIDAERGFSGSSPGSNSVRQRAAKARERDANGRFVSSGTEESKGSLLKSGMSIGSGGMPDSGGIDPTVDAIKELKDFVSPVGRVFGGMSARAIGLLRGRLKKRRSEEILPEEQVKANKEQSRNDKQRNKLLERLIDAVRSKNGGGLGGLLGLGGGLLKRGGGLMKGLLRKVPFLGLLIGGGLLAKDWGSLDSGGKGKGIGQIVGTALGGFLGSFFGPIGTVGGGVLGNLLGGIFGQKIGTWVSDLKDIDFGEIFKNAVSEAFNLGKKALTPFSGGATFGTKALAGAISLGTKAVNGAKSVGNKAVGWAKGVKDYFTGGSTATTGDNIDYSNAVGNKNDQGNVATDRKARQLGMYNALRGAGFSHEQALAVGGEIGRENEYGNALFSTHTDKARDEKGRPIRNGGALSWNRGRYEKFSKFMRDRGLMDANGDMPKTQATLDAQAQFIKSEMEDPNYKKNLKGFFAEPHKDPKSYAGELAKHIGWARGQTSVRGPNGTRVAFDSKPHEKKVASYIDSSAEMTKEQSNNISKNKSVPAAKGKPKKVDLVTSNNRPKATKVAEVKPEVANIRASSMPKASSVPADNSIGQTVSDRGLAHIQAGGMGYNSHSA
jgi:tetrahydromethanopterin S-methyltransferase subunit F